MAVILAVDDDPYLRNLPGRPDLEPPVSLETPIAQIAARRETLARP